MGLLGRSLGRILNTFSPIFINPLFLPPPSLFVSVPHIEIIANELQRLPKSIRFLGQLSLTWHAT